MLARAAVRECVARVFAIVAVLHFIPSIAFGQDTPQNGGGGAVPNSLPVPFEVQVTPDNAVGPTRSPNTGPYNIAFMVTNTGQNADTYSLACNHVGSATACGPVTPASVTLASGAKTTVTASYSVGAVGTGTVTVVAEGQDNDGGSYTITVANPPPTPSTPLVSLVPYNGEYRSPSTCAVSCFDVVWAHATPAYFSLGAPRSFGLVYNSAMARPTPTLAFDLSNTANHVPTSYSIQVKSVATGAFLTLLNGTQAVYYLARATDTTRVVVPIDAVANGLTTGWTDVTINVTSNYGSDSVGMRPVSARFLVDNETASPFGTGVGAAGIQRVYSQAGSFAALITEGDGTIAYYDRTCGTCSYKTPSGSTATLYALPGAVPWRRVYLDGSSIDFNTAGLAILQVDRFGNSTALWYTGTQLDSVIDPMGKRLKMTYLGGKLQSVTDAAARVTSYTIDVSNRLTRVTDPDNLFTTLGYSTAGLLTTVTNRAGSPTDFAYDVLNRIDTSKAPSVTLYTGSAARPRVVARSADRVVWQPGITGVSAATAKTAIRYDTVYAQLTDQLGAVTRMTVDRFGAPLRVIDVLGKITTISRDSMSRPTFVVEPNGHQTTLAYNVLPTMSPYLLVKQTDVTTGKVLDYTYGPANNLTSVRGGPARQDFFYHTGTPGPTGTRAGTLDSSFIGNAFNNVWPTLGGGALLEARHYTDSRGRDTLVTDGGAHSNRFHYESVWGNVDTVTDARGMKKFVLYDEAGRPDTVYIPTMGKFGYDYDKLNRVVAERQPLNQLVTTAYNAIGLVTKLVDAKGQIYRFDYNALGALVTRKDLGDTTKVETIKYDSAGRARSIQTRRGDVISMTYDVAGRLLNRTGPDFPTDTYRYDPSGRWTVAVNSAAYDSLVYDQAGRLSSSLQKVIGAAAQSFRWNYTLDAQSRVTQRVLSTGSYSSSWSFDTQYGTINAATGAGIQMTVHSNNEQLPDQRIYNLLANQWSSARTFSPTHLTSADTFSTPGLDAKMHSTLVYDSLDHVRSQAYAGHPKRVFTYDSFGRLVNACDSTGGQCLSEFGNTSTPYKYDPAGNRILGAEGVINIGAGNRINFTAGWYLKYDLNGDVISKCDGPVTCTTGYKYTWDALGRMKDVRGSNNAVIATITYDALGRRVAKVTATATERYVYDRDQVVLDLDAALAVKREYLFYPGTDALLAEKNASWTGIAVTDPIIGTVHGIANYAGGGLLKHYDATAWGKIAADTGVVTRYRMAGREYDQETRLYYMRARYYDPDLGRFLSEDPYGIAGGLNLYAYANNDPINLRDPSGTCPPGYEPDWGGGGGCVRTLGGVTGTGNSGHRCDLGCGGAPGWADAGFRGGSATGNFIGPDNHKNHGGYGLTPIPISVTNYGQAGRCGLEGGALLTGMAVDAANFGGAMLGVGEIAAGTRIALGGMAGEVGSLVNTGAAVSRAGGFVFVMNVASTSSISTMAGSVRIAAGIAAVADATYIGLGNEKGALNPQPGFPFSLSDLSLTMAAVETYDKCLAR
jgi:RHS repeat-associated protein